MPKPRDALNGFTPKEAARITGLSVHMLNYLARNDFLIPAYPGNARGKTRYYSYRDLVVARVVQKLLAAGLEISRLKAGIARMSTDLNWTSLGSEGALRTLVTDGIDLYLYDEDGSLLDLTRGGQMAFAFVLDVSTAASEVRGTLDDDRLAVFSYKDEPLRFAELVSARSTTRPPG